jgi:hypothetical protein
MLVKREAGKNGRCPGKYAKRGRWESATPCIKLKCPTSSFTDLLNAPGNQFSQQSQRDLPCPPPAQKIIRFSAKPNHLKTPPRLTRTRGGSRSSRTRVEMRWTQQRRARIGDRRAGLSCERCVSARTNDASTPPPKLRQTAHGLSNRWRGRCVRRKRVVLASVADAKARGGEIGPTGSGAPSIRGTTVTRGIRRRGELAISR